MVVVAEVLQAEEEEEAAHGVVAEVLPEVVDEEEPEEEPRSSSNPTDIPAFSSQKERNTSWLQRTWSLANPSMAKNAYR